MKVVVVNDCAHCVEDMLPFLSREVEIQFLKRTRSFTDKTLGLIWHVLRSCGDVFHVNYGLQDAWFTRKLKGLDVLWLHGSDVRDALRTKRYGWAVRGNILKAKRVLVSTPDLLEPVSKMRGDVALLERPVRTDVFLPKQTCNKRNLTAIYFPKSYDHLPPKLPKLFELNGIRFFDAAHIEYANMPNFLQNFDIFVDQTTLPALSKTCLEAMSCGLAVFNFQHRSCLEERVKQLSDVDFVRKEGLANRRFVVENHDARKMANELLEVWREVSEFT